jgi:hypothetical protein
VTKTSVVSSFPLFKSLLFYSSQLSAKKTALKARHWWLMPVILPTQEAEISRIEVQNQLRQIVCETLSQKTHHKKGLVEWFKV